MEASSPNKNTVRSRSAPTAENVAGDESRVPTPVHLHIVSESKGHALGEVSQKVRSQYTDRQITEHVHPPVRSSRQLKKILKNIEATPGIVIYSLSKREVVNKLEQFCKKIDVPCFAGPKLEATNRTIPSRRMRMAVLSSLATLLILAVAIKSFVPYLADAEGGVNAETAPRLPLTTAAALVNAAEAKLGPINRRVSEQQAAAQQESAPANSSPDETDNPALSIDPDDTQSLTEIRSMLESALRKDPLNSRALDLLGQVTQLQGDEQRTEQLMEAAARRSLHNAYPAYWRLVKSYEDKDFPSAIQYADRLLRARGPSGRRVFPILAKMAEIPEATSELEQVLKENPPWRSEFFRRIKSYITDVRTPLNLFLALENTPAAATSEERSAYVQFLVDRGFYEVAYYTWLQFLPDDQLNSLGGLFNGNFETTPTKLPFDWGFANQAGVIVELTDHPDEDGRALFMKFGPGRVNLGDVKQLVVLPPGKYKLEGLQKVDLLSKKGFFWQVSCAKTRTSDDGEKLIGAGPAIEGRNLAWNSFSFDFTVPNTDCPAQYVRLSSAARAASDQFMSGSVWFDDLQITRE
jgi:hypothetical protein